MASPYTSQSSSGYNATPPADDGSAVASNQVLWATIKTKLGDPVKNLADNINSAISTAVGKMPGGASTSTQSTSYQVLSSDQGKLIIATASGITVTTPDATSVSTPFQFRVLNNSSGTITVDGSGTQTIDGNLTITVSAGAGVTLDTDGTNWYTNGIQGTLVGKQLMYGDIINGTIVESNASNAVTYALKTLAGSDPSSSDPVLICFRSPTAGTGNYVYRTVTAALSLTISSGSTLGTVSAVPCKIWIVIFDDGGTIRLGAINCVTATSATAVTAIYPLGRVPRASSTAEGGAGAADSSGVFYTGTAVSSKAYVPLGFCLYESGLATAGTWNVSPDSIQLFGHGVPLPGDVIQVAENATGAVAVTSNTIPYDDTIPQSGEGAQFMSQAITPTSATNILHVEHNGTYGTNTGTAADIIVALFQDAVANAIAANIMVIANALNPGSIYLGYKKVASTSSSTTFKINAGSPQAVTTTINGANNTRALGGVMASFLRVRELSS